MNLDRYAARERHRADNTRAQVIRHAQQDNKSQRGEDGLDLDFGLRLHRRILSRSILSCLCG